MRYGPHNLHVIIRSIFSRDFVRQEMATRCWVDALITPINAELGLADDAQKI